MTPVPTGHAIVSGTVASCLVTLALPAVIVGFAVARSPDMLLIWAATASPVSGAPAGSTMTTLAGKAPARQPSRNAVTALSGAGCFEHAVSVASRARTIAGATNRVRRIASLCNTATTRDSPANQRCRFVHSSQRAGPAGRVLPAGSGRPRVGSTAPQRGGARGAAVPMQRRATGGYAPQTSSDDQVLSGAPVSGGAGDFDTGPGRPGAGGQPPAAGSGQGRPRGGTGGLADSGGHAEVELADRAEPIEDTELDEPLPDAERLIADAVALAGERSGRARSWYAGTGGSRRTRSWSG